MTLLLSIAIVILVIIKYFSFKRRLNFWNSLKVGDWVVGGGLGGYYEDEYVVEKTDDSIWLSNSGWLSKGEFLFYGDLDYFSREDWYFM